MIPHIGLGESVVLLVVVLLLFGPKRLPDLAGSLGKAIKSFKQELRDSSKEDSEPEKPA